MRGKSRIVTIIGILVCIVTIIIIRSSGIIDLNLYDSKLDSNQSSSIASTELLESYDISFVYDGKEIYNHTIIKNNQKAVSVIVEIEKYQYSGNYYMPFYKNFTMMYKCIFKTTNINNNKVFDGNNQFDGKIEGNIKSTIKGVCSIKKAKELSEDKAFKAIKDYIITTLSK